MNSNEAVKHYSDLMMRNIALRSPPVPPVRTTTKKKTKQRKTVTKRSLKQTAEALREARQRGLHIRYSARRGMFVIGPPVLAEGDPFLQNEWRYKQTELSLHYRFEEHLAQAVLGKAIKCEERGELEKAAELRDQHRRIVEIHTKGWPCI